MKAPNADAASVAPFRFEWCIKDADVEEAVDLYLHRRLAFWLVLKPIEKLGLTRVTPMHLTLLSIVIGITAGVVTGMAATHGPAFCVIGAFLLLTHVVLDCADGMLARLRGGGSRLGMLIDGLGDAIVAAVFGAGLSCAMSVSVPGVLLWPALAAIVPSVVAHTALYDHIRTGFTDAITPRSVAPAPSAPHRPDAFERAIEQIYAFYQWCGRAVGKAAPETSLPAIDPTRARAALRPAMRSISWIGVGSSMLVLYSSALLVPVWPAAPLVVGLFGFTGIGNVVMLIALQQLRRGERELATDAALTGDHAP